MPDLPFIAIIGSADEPFEDYEVLGADEEELLLQEAMRAEFEKRYQPPITDFEEAKQAARELGLELAKAGFGLIVYSGDPQYIEHHVVEGFLQHPLVGDASIRLITNRRQLELADEVERVEREPSGPRARFHIPAGKQRVFGPTEYDESDHWEVSFYRSLRQADGVLLIGGGLSTLNAGLVAIANRIPLLALASFGGKAQIVQESIQIGKDLPSRSEVDLMARPWTGGMAVACVRALGNQARRSLAADPAGLVRAARIAGGLLLVALFAAALAWAPVGEPWSLPGMAAALALFLGPLLAGAAGAVVRVLVGASRDFHAATWHSIEVAGWLGGIVGGIVTTLFIAAQLGTNGSLTSGGDPATDFMMRLIPFALAGAFVAGLTLDQVLAKLIRMDVLRRADPHGGEA
ncbi:MAG: hypothetical protein P1V81_16130 [Planctomycetota bacterium]|nr:hypothetical protein [Planctomycetota bacterium]